MPREVVPALTDAIIQN